jgi:hypothetical protein
MWLCGGSSTLLLLIVHALIWSSTLLELVSRKSTSKVMSVVNGQE